MSNSLNNIDVVILCGGLGTRLKSEIGDAQKVMTAIDDEPFLNLKIEQVKEQGVRRVVLCTGHQAQDVEDYYSKNSLGITISLSKEEEPLGTGGAIKNAQSLVQSDHFFAMNGDCFSEVDFQALLDYHLSQKSLATLVVSRVKDGKDYGGITLDSSRRIIAFEEKKTSIHEPYVNVGVYCFQREIFTYMPKEQKFSIEYDFFPTLTEKPFFGFLIDGEFLDIGTPDRLDKAKKIFKKDP